MRLYVESNFVLELAFHQEHSADCEQLLQFAETGELQLVVPSYCLAEPHETLARRHKKRLSLQNDIQAELGQLRRSSNYRKVAEQVNLASSLFATSAQEDRERLADVITRLSEAGRLVPVTRAVVRRAYEVQRDLAMGPQDSFVLASVLQDLDDYPAPENAFVTRNTSDFDDPDVIANLTTRGCRLLAAFGAAVALVRQGLN